MSFIFSKTVLDSDWASHAFRLRPEDMSAERIIKRRYYTTSARKFVDTSWGGHFAVNPFPQFTRNCDVNHTSLYTGNRVMRDNYGDFGGVGRWWSEVLDDNQQEIHIRAGVVRYNSMFTFFTNFYNVEASILSRRGKATSLFYSLGKAAGYVGSIMLQPFILGAEAINFFMSTPRTKFYYLSPAMHMYWRAVSSMMNTYLVNVGLTSFYDPGDNSYANKDFYDPIVSQYNQIADLNEQQRIFGSKFGDRITTKNGAIDVFAISTRAERLGQEYRARVNKLLDDSFKGMKSSNRDEIMERFIEDKLDSLIGRLPGPGAINQKIADKAASIRSAEEKPDSNASYLDMYMAYQMSSSYGSEDKEAIGLLRPDGDQNPNAPDFYPNSVSLDNPVTAAMFSENKPPENSESITYDENTTLSQTGGSARHDSSGTRGGKFYDKPLAYFKEVGNAFRGNMDMGAEFVTFRINHTSTHSESFSNTSGESTLMETINANSSTARSTRFNLAGGNIGGPLGFALNAIEDTMAGMLDSIGAGGLMALGGTAFVDIQKVYQNSSADMMTTSLSIPLRAWSADLWTISKDIAYPLFCALALGMPKSTGNRSYDEPFLLETFLRGRSQIREGRVRSISITRGTGDIGWTKDGHALGIDLNIEIEDMSGVVGVPINPATSRVAAMVSGAAGAVAGAIGGDGAANAVDTVAAAITTSTYSEDNKFGDYMNVLGAVDLHRQINSIQKWKLRMAQTRASMEQWRTAHAAMSVFADTLPGIMIQAIGRPTDRN